MIQYPGAEWKPLGPQTQPRMGAHDIVCVHTMVGFLKGTYAGFLQNGYGGLESTYGIGGSWGSDVAAKLNGVIYQFQNRLFTADANYKGSWHVISIETADNAPQKAEDIARWTAAQASALVNLIAWECSPAAHAECPESWFCRKGVMWEGHRVAIPPVLIPDTLPGRRGLAMHRQGVTHSRGVGVTGYRVSGGEEWSTSVGKPCPGDARAKQFVSEIIPRVQEKILAKSSGKVTAVTASTTPSDADIQSALKAVFADKFIPNRPDNSNPDAAVTYFSPASILANIETDDDNFRVDVRARLDTIERQLTAIMSALKIPDIK